MGLLAFLNLEATDVGALVVTSLLGYFAGTLAPPGMLAIFTTLLVAYHLFLAWLVFGSRYKIAAPTSVIAMLVTHGCCLVLVTVPVLLARNVIPFFDFFRYAMVGLALFERGWLFSGSEIRQAAKLEPVKPQLTPRQLMPKVKLVPKPAAAPQANELPLTMAKTGQSLDEWERHMARQRPGTREYEKWMRARRSKHAAEKRVSVTQQSSSV